MKKTLAKALFLTIFSGISFFAQATPPDTIRTAIKLGIVKQYCVDTSDFVGTMTTFDDICGATSGNAVNFVILPNFCVSYGGLDLGTESSCLVYCDNTGQCDTTVFIVSVVPDSVSTLPAIAVDDYMETMENTPVTKDLLENDLLPNNGAFTSIQMLSQGDHGVGSIDIDGVITYTPSQDFCGDNDTLVYEVCNIVSCDTANIYVTVAECLNINGLLVYDGFSPNGDFINDYWKIIGLEDIPDHHIYVYNRWGNLVFETKNYQNDWDGKWDTTPLAPGTYFYLIHSGQEKKQSGYIQISY